MKNIAKNIIKLIILIFIWPWEKFRENTNNPIIPFSIAIIVSSLLFFKYGFDGYDIYISLLICIPIGGFGYPILSIFLRSVLDRYVS